MMQSIFGRVAVATGVASALIVSVACSTGGGATASDPGSACDDYYDKAISSQYKCLGVTFPADVNASRKARFRTECLAALAYPGQGFTPATLSACAAVYGSAACRGSNGAAAACGAVIGTLADGVACNGSSQCKSGFCKIVAVPPSDGGASANACGACAPSVAVGQSCASGTCIVGAACVGGTCVATGSVAVGGVCNSASDCQTGLACSAQKCAALAASGGACSSSAGCQNELVCDKMVCGAPVALGGDCSATSPSCAVGAICDFAGTKKCLALAFAKAGAACGVTPAGYVLCAVGACNTEGPAGTCPAIIADGQACNATDRTKTCDSLAECKGSVCTLGDPVCK